MSDSAVADPAVDQSTVQPVRPVTSGPGSLARSFSLLLALASGALLTLAFPGFNLWPLAPVALAGLALATRGHRARFAALAGFLFGLAFFVPHLHWSGIYVGKLPWFALATAEAVFLAGLGALLPRIWRVPGGAAGTVLAGTGLWVLQEAARDRVPFGGVPWGRGGSPQPRAPPAGLAALGGAPLVTAAVAAVGTALAVAVLALAPLLTGRLGRMSAARGETRPAVVRGLLALAAAAVLLGCGLLVPLP